MSTTNPLLARPTRPLPKRIGVVGAGTIGPDIAYYLASALPGATLVLVDIAEDRVERALARLRALAQKGVAKGKLTEVEAKRITEAFEGTLDYGRLAGCDWVIEAATEDIALKRAIFARIEAAVGASAIITSNTSSLPASRLFAGLAHPDRATVTHFFAPAYQNPAVEVVASGSVAPEVVDHLRWVFAVTGKVPLVTADVVCFMLDRVFDNWCNEAAYLLDEATAAEVDAVAASYVHAGPFQVLNLAHGNPIIVETNTLQMEEGACYRPAPIFRSVATWQTSAPGATVAVPDDRRGRIADRLLGVAWSQVFDILDRRIGAAEDLELGSVLALGFEKGPLDLMAERGDGEVRRIMDRLAADRPGMPMPARAPSEYLRFRRHVLVDRRDGVEILTLRRPQALNALDDRVTDELAAVIAEREADPEVTGFVLVGYGTKAFSAGADIGRFPEVLGKPDEAAQYARDCSRLLVRLDRIQKPVVAALNGMALGGGLELALRCHAIVAVRTAWLQLPEITLGIAPGIGGIVVPYRRWPRAAAIFHEMACRATKLGAEHAREIGVIDALADDYADLVSLAVRRVKDLAGAPLGVPEGPVDLGALAPLEAGGKRFSAEVAGIIDAAIRSAAAASTLEAGLEIGYRAFAASACTAAAREGIGAFLDRRKPDFSRTP